MTASARQPLSSQRDFIEAQLDLARKSLDRADEAVSDADISRAHIHVMRLIQSAAYAAGGLADVLEDYGSD